MPALPLDATGLPAIRTAPNSTSLAPASAKFLAESLAMAESAPPMARAHARGYAAMLADVLGLLDQRVQADPEDWPAIDPGAVLVQQLGRLTPEQVRSLGYALSRRVGIP